jgi:hypothetical protein
MALAVTRHFAVPSPELAGRVPAGGFGAVAFLFGVAPLRTRRTVGTVAIQEHSVLVVAVCAAIVLLSRTLACLVRLLLGVGAAVL